MTSSKTRATHDVAIAACHAIWPDGPQSEGAAMLRLDPWRLHVADAVTVTGPRVWKAGTEYR